MGFHKVHDATVHADALSPRLVHRFSEIMRQGPPLFVGRIGGSDYDLVVEHFNDPRRFASDERYAYGVGRVREFNGYFDVEDRRENFVRFLEDLAVYYRSADALLYGGGKLIHGFERNRFKKADSRFLDHVCGGKELITYTFIEELSPFLESFRDWGQGKRILVVSPLSRSVESQYRRKDELIKGYRFPEFELATYNSNVTYSTAGDTTATLGVTTRNWHEECLRMAHDIAEIDFDIALLSCASYALFLGDFIRNRLRRTALYMGGVLSPMFNIYGPRYDDEHFNGLMNLERQIDPIENEEVERLQGGRSRHSEALHAYFGRRSSSP